MRIVVNESQSSRLFSVRHQNEYTTIRDILLAAHLDLRNWETIWLDDIQVTLDTSLRNVALLEGSTLSNSRPPQDPQTDWILLTSGGLQAGAAYPLQDNYVTRIGRSNEASVTLDSPSVSWSHCAVSTEGTNLRIYDENSSNGTFVNGERIDSPDGILINEESQLSVGGVTFAITHPLNEPRVIRPSSSKLLTGASTIPFNRPPRLAAPLGPDPIELPVKKEPQKANKFSWIAVIAPLAMAAMMVIVMGSLRFAFIALLSPLMAIGAWWEQKRRAKASEKEEDERFSNELNSMTESIKEASDRQRHCLRYTAPNTALSYQRARVTSTKIWQRRPKSSDYLYVCVGDGNQPYAVPIESSQKSLRKTPEVQQILSSAVLQAAPIAVNLADGPIGLWGHRSDCLSIARAILNQLATHVGPADLSIGVFTDSAKSQDWRWTSWLPHLQHSTLETDFVQLGLSSEVSTKMLRTLRDSIEGNNAHTLLLVIDGHSLLEGRDCPARDLLNRGQMDDNPGSKKRTTAVTGLVIADNREQLPAACNTVIHVQYDANLSLSYPRIGLEITDIIGSGVTLATAEHWARMLACLDDPEVKNHNAALPSLSHLLTLLELENPTPELLLNSWVQHNDFYTPIGIGENGVYGINLVKDGPHGLVGGTTGSGKSEFLRSLVAGLAARVDPEHLNFILIDFKGGAAFASCDQLPHTIGTVSNLDEQLAKRAIEALKAEIRYRQTTFAQAGEGIDNLNAYLATNPSRPMPRILVVIDEFKELATTYPDVLSSLVSVAAVGRTLGIHMILATQRPDGIVNDDILANTNMRVALRVQDKSDSSNVIGVPYASSIGRNQQGRAYVKLGEDDITSIQTALVTGHCTDTTSTTLSIIETELGATVTHDPIKTKDKETNDLNRLINAIIAANAQAGFAPPRPVWPEPLQEQIELALPGTELANLQSVVVPTNKNVLNVAISDAPERQCQYAAGWNLEKGNLLLFGLPGSGTTTTLASLIYSAACSYTPEECDIVILDLGTRDLELLSGLPHTLSYVPPGAQNRELHERFLRYLSDTFARRSQRDGNYKPLFVFIDGLNTLRDDFRDSDAASLLDSFYQVWEKGPEVGMYFAASSSRFKAAPTQVLDITASKWLFRLSEPAEYIFAGLRQGEMPQQVPGRYIDFESRHHSHIATPKVSHEQAIELIRAHYPNAQLKRPAIASLPLSLAPTDLHEARCNLTNVPRRIPVGLRNEDLTPAFLEAYEGEHVLISGPSRSGKSTVLEAIARKLRADSADSGDPVTLLAICSNRSPLRNSTVFDSVDSFEDPSMLLIQAETATSPTVLFVDDAEQFDDTSQMLSSLSTSMNSNLLLIASANNNTLKSLYSHWIRKMGAKSRLGVLLMPDPNYDGEFLGVTIPQRRNQSMSVARGYLCCNGTMDLIQAATYQHL